MATAHLQHFSGEVIEEKFLTCSICLEKFKTPKLLPCLHTFCLKCLEDHIRSSAQEETFPCPCCRQSTKVPTNVAADFKNNFFMNSLLDFFAGSASSQNCSFCSSLGKTEKAVTKCIDCSDYLCETCTKGHGMTRLTVKHKLIPIDQLQKIDMHKGVSAKAGFPCSEHPVENVRYYCTVCEKPVCRDCKALDHHQHHCVAFEEAAHERKAKMKNSLEFLQNELQKAEDWKSSVKQDSANILNGRDLCVQEIEEACSTMIASLLRLKNETIEQINAKSSESLKQVKAEEEAADMRSTQIKSFREYLTNVLNVGADVEILETYSLARKQNMFPKENASKQEPNCFQGQGFYFGQESMPQPSINRRYARAEKASTQNVRSVCPIFSNFSSAVRNIVSIFIKKCSELPNINRNLFKRLGLQ